MARINIFEQPTEDTDQDDRPRVLGWFDPARAERFPAGTYYRDGNPVDRVTGSEWIDAILYRTATGRWIEQTDATRYHRGVDTYRFLSDDEARDWFIRNEDDEAVKRFFGELPEESGPAPVGRPEIGGRVTTSLGDRLLQDVDLYAASKGLTRAQAIRKLLAFAVDSAAAGSEYLV